jgi:hypothetical protein
MRLAVGAEQDWHRLPEVPWLATGDGSLLDQG